MKTKLVYVVASNENDIYLERTLLSVCSARIYMPDAEIVLITDDLTDATLCGKRRKISDYITSKTVVKIDEKYNNIQRSRILKTSLREHITGDFLFIDSDTVITSSLEEADTFDFDIGAVKNLHKPSIKEHFPSQYISRIMKYVKKLKYPITEETAYFNSGVIYVKDSVAAERFFYDWNKYWFQCHSQGIDIDQVAFTMADIQNNSIIHELSGIWNCQTKFGFKYLKDSKIIHLFGIENYYMFPEIQNKELYSKIKKIGYIDEKTVEMIKNRQNYFAESIFIICNQEIRLWNSYSVTLLRSLRNKYFNLFRFVEFFSKCCFRIWRPSNSILKNVFKINK